MRGAKNKAVVGVFTYMDDAIRAVKTFKDKQFEYRVYSPVPNHELEDVIYPEKSPVRFVTTTGAVSGLIAGFALAIWTSMDWPLRASAKDIVSTPGFVVIGYEWTILWGGLATLFAIFHFCKIPNLFRAVGYDPRFSHDKFGIVVGCGGDDVESVREVMLNSGADEVEVRDGL